MRDVIEKEISREYQNRQNSCAQATQDNIERVYWEYPELAEIDHLLMQENATIALEILGDGIIRETSARKEELLSKRDEFLKKSNIPKEFDSPVHRCVLCNDTGRLIGTDNSLCKCYYDLLIPKLVEKSNLGSISQYTFSKFDINLFSSNENPEKYGMAVSPRRQMEGIRAISDKFITAFDQNDTRSLFFIGNPGRGKTFISGCIANELIKKGKFVLYFSSSELFEEIEHYRMLLNSFAPNPERLDKSQMIYNSILSCDLLIIDDFGTETQNASRKPELLSILNHRSGCNKKFIISTNLDIKSLASFYDERVLSRIYGNFNLITFIGEDLRHNKK
jgi:DNA replication protein DnaC